MAYLKSVKTMINDLYEKFTDTEKRIADYFLQDDQSDGFSSQVLSKRLYVSEASLSRFAKKLGFRGYRELIYAYTENIQESKRLDALTESSLHRYEIVLELTHQLVDNEQMIRLAKTLDEKKRVFVYGVGSSALAGKEFAYRFIRLGLDVDALCDKNEISQNLPRVNADCLVIGISLSGNTKEVIDELKRAHEKGAHIVLMTMAKTIQLDYADEIVHLAHVKNLTVSHIISPQVPALIMIDILYTHYLNYNRDSKMNSLKETLDNIDYTMEK